MPDEETKTLSDFSSGLQRKTNRFLAKENELRIAENVSYEEIGSISKKKGYTQKGDDLTSTTTTSTSTSTTTTSTSSSTSTSTSTSSSSSSSTTTTSTSTSSSTSTTTTA